MRYLGYLSRAKQEVYTSHEYMNARKAAARDGDPDAVTCQQLSQLIGISGVRCSMKSQAPHA